MRLFGILCVALAVATASACMPSQKTRESEERIQKNITKFYRNAADAYFMIGWEYYNLAQDMEKAGKIEQSQSYAAKSRVYVNISKEWKKMADQTESGGDPASLSPTGVTPPIGGGL